MLFAFAFDVNVDVIKIHYHENVKFLCRNFVDVNLKGSWCTSQSKKYYLVLKIAMVVHKTRFLFIAFPDPYLMVGVGKIKLDKTSSPT